jgi:hypothetical protein
MTKIERPEGQSTVLSAAEQVVRAAQAVDSRINHTGAAGSGYVIPKTKKLRTAAREIAEYADAEESTTDLTHLVTNKHFYPACYALSRVLADHYGVDYAKPKPGFFGPRNPIDITFPLSATKTATVTLGEFTLNGMTVNTQPQGDRLRIFVQCQNSDKAAAMELFALVDAYSDCWAGQTLVFDKADSNGPRTPQIVAPDLTVGDIALNGSEEAALRMFLNQIEHHDILAREHDIPFKRGVLLYGPWGTGKTLAAAVAMASCRRAGITVIQERIWSSLESTMQLARTMQPCMVFCEDIDIVSNRSLTNILDDATLKDCAVSLVVTTNNPEKLDPALTRTGRLDIAIGFALPDRNTRERILAINNAPFYNDDIAEATIDFTGSDLAEVAKRATINAVAAQRPMQADDVLGGAYSLKRPPAYVAPDTLADALGQVAEALGIKHLQDTVDDIESTVDNLG